MKLFSLPLFWTYLIIYNKYLKDKSYQKISLLKFSTIALLTSFFTSIVNFLMLLYLDITLLDQKNIFLQLTISILSITAIVFIIVFIKKRHIGQKN
ncbi:hypothetical protein [Gallibacterium anatis]|uniref:Uncharacterized protein n=1 Tax=Gallibacterium anatis 4895 TaxID=1396510 RepID=A0A0A2ZVZ5_9PAST|nr:hypothetical protein [Gallibacterium anatis]KGQ41713.1 hypothetical protein JP30_04230 [Gallibacterium anatis IPDH697-78]KGQ61201.1 hypothetical protein IO48_07890 [Gallibacterium anatis 4895]KGQ64744.1 hypothetical protein IO43_05190 [Gallibacterium anatis 7990]